MRRSGPVGGSEAQAEIPQLGNNFEPPVDLCAGGQGKGRVHAGFVDQSALGCVALFSAYLPTAWFPLLAAAPAAHVGERSTAVFLGQVLLLLLVGRLLGEAMQRLRQPAVMGQLLAGVLLGPSVLGALWPGGQHALFPVDPEQKKMLDAVSQLGVLMLLLLTGMETDLKLVKRVGRTAACASLGGVVFPFICGFVLGECLPASMLPDAARRLPTSLFLATALSISSIKIVAAVLREVNFLKRDLGQVIVAAAILDDTLGWIIVALIGGIASQGTVQLTPLLTSVLGTVAFLGISFTVGRKWVARLIRWTNDHFVIEMPVISAILVLMLGLALFTNFIGVHTVLGAFVAGVLVGQSPILTKHIEEELRGLIVALFMPVFFGVAGLSIDLTVLRNPHLLALAVGFIAIASFGKLVGCYFGGRLGRLGPRESTALAIGMNARGSTEIIVASIGLAMGVLNRELFTLIVLMAITTTLVTPPLLRWALARVPVSDDESARMKTEAAEARGFVPQLERLLVAADDSPDGRLAARLGGLFVGTRQLTATVLNLAGSDGSTNGASPDASLTRVQRAAHEATRTVRALHRAAHSGPKPKKGTVSALVAAAERDGIPETLFTAEELVSAATVIPLPGSAPDQAVLAETENGYDMLFLGLSRASAAGTSPDASPLSERVEAIVRASHRPVAVVLARPPLAAALDGGTPPLPLNILLPTGGSDQSLASAEVAVAIAKGSGARLTALHVSRPPTENDLLRYPHEVRVAGRTLVRELQSLGSRQGVEITVRVLARPVQEAAILHQIEHGGHNLVVLGVKVRQGEHLSFSQSVGLLLAQIPCSVVLIAF